MTSTPLRDPIQIVCTRARGYLYHNRYPQVIVFSRYLSELDHLVATFGGHYYRHLAGYTWVLSRHEDIIELIGKVKPHLPSKWGFENVLERDHLPSN